MSAGFSTQPNGDQQKPNPSFYDKVDPVLLETIEMEKGKETTLRVVLSLSSKTYEGSLNAGKPKAQDFSSQVAYRKALIDHQDKVLQQELGSTFEELKKLSIVPNGDLVSRIVIAEGKVGDIEKAIYLPGVEFASLDGEVELADESKQFLEEAKELYEIAKTALPIKSRGIADFLISRSRLNATKGYRDFQRYIRYFKAEYGRVQILSMQNPVELEDIFINPEVYEKDWVSSDVAWDAVDWDSAEALEDDDGYGFQLKKSSKCSSKKGMEAVKEEKYLLILGDPGSGKSVLLRKIGLEVLKVSCGELPSFGCIPVLLEVKDLSLNEIDIKLSIVKNFENNGFQETGVFVENLLEGGKVILLLDGIDEVPSERLKKIAKAIEEFVSRYPENRYVVSCRKAARCRLERFCPVEIDRFKRPQINQFIENWFASHSNIYREKDLDQECIKALNPRYNPRACELAQTPLLLTFLCLVFGKERTFVDNKAKLYKAALDILVKEWVTRKYAGFDEVLQKLRLIEEELLSEIAYNAFRKGKVFFHREELLKFFDGWLKRRAGIPKGLGAEVVLNAVSLQQGILLEREKNVYSFSHLTLQEYLAAFYITEIRKEWFIVDDGKFYDTRWREVTLLVSGLAFPVIVEKFLLRMSEQIGEFSQDPKISKLLTWVNQRLDVLSEHPSGDISNQIPRRARLMEFLLKCSLAVEGQEKEVRQYVERAIYFLQSPLFKEETFDGARASLDPPKDLDLAREMLRALEYSYDCVKQAGYHDLLMSSLRRSIMIGEELQSGFEHIRRQKIAKAQAPRNQRHLYKVPNQIFSIPNFPKFMSRLKIIYDTFLSKPSLSSEDYYEGYKELQQLSYHLFMVKPSLVELSPKEARFIERYIYSCEVIEACLNLSKSLTLAKVSDIQRNVLSLT